MDFDKQAAFDEMEIYELDIALVRIFADYETGERCGAAGTFQVAKVEIETHDEYTRDVTNLIDQGYHYLNTEDVLETLEISKDVDVEVESI